MHKIFTYFFASLLGIVLLGCSKDKNPAPTKTELLTNKNWIVTGQTVNPGIDIGNGVIVTDFYALAEACNKDNFIRFETPNIYKQDEGATRCDQSDPQSTTGTWSLNSDQTILTLADNRGNTSNFNVTELTSSTLKLVFVDRTGGVDYTFTVTFRKG